MKTKTCYCVQQYVRGRWFTVEISSILRDIKIHLKKFEYINEDGKFRIIERVSTYRKISDKVIK